MALAGGADRQLSVDWDHEFPRAAANCHITKPCRLFKDLAAQMAPSLFPDLPA